MGFTVSIDASEKIELGVETVTKVSFITDTPDDSNARSNDLGLGLVVEGRIRANMGGVADETVKLPKYALTPAEDKNCYANVTAKVEANNIVVREITLTQAYVVAYSEHIDDTTGVGTFKLVLRQKKDMNSAVSYQGGFAN